MLPAASANPFPATAAVQWAARASPQTPTDATKWPPATLGRSLSTHWVDWNAPGALWGPSESRAIHYGTARAGARRRRRRLISDGQTTLRCCPHASAWPIVGLPPLIGRPMRPTKFTKRVNHCSTVRPHFPHPRWPGRGAQAHDLGGRRLDRLHLYNSSSRQAGSSLVTMVTHAGLPMGHAPAAYGFLPPAQGLYMAPPMPATGRRTTGTPKERAQSGKRAGRLCPAARAMR